MYKMNFKKGILPESKREEIFLPNNFLNRKLFTHLCRNDLISQIRKKTIVTQICKRYLPYYGGVEAVVKQVVDSLESGNNFDIEVMTCSNIYKSSIEGDIRVKRCKFLFEFKSNPISPNFIFNLSRVKTDVLHYHHPFIFSVIAHFLAKPKYKKLITTYHSDIVGYEKIMKPFWSLYRKFLDKTDKIIVLSPNIIESSSVLRRYREKCVVIPYGIDLSNYEQSDPKLVQEIKNKYGNKKIILSVGRLVKYKGFKYAIEAMKKVNYDAVLVIIGSGQLYDELKNQINENNLQNKVFMTGKIRDEELKAYYQACDIFVLPSIMNSEAFGIVQAEAMVNAKPVINTNLGTGVNYVSIDGKTGLTVEPENSQQLADAIIELLNNDNLRLKLGGNGRERVESVFDINKVKKAYNDLFEGLIRIC